MLPYWGGAKKHNKIKGKDDWEGTEKGYSSGEDHIGITGIKKGAGPLTLLIR